MFYGTFKHLKEELIEIPHRQYEIKKTKTMEFRKKKDAMKNRNFEQSA